MHHVPATRWCLIGLLLLTVLAQNGDAATLIVPDQFAGIQLAIDATADGDTVLVRAGTYIENITFVEKPISVISESGPAMTTIDGSSASESAVQMSGLTGSSIEGFTITGGSGSGVGVTRGGGIWVWPDVSTVLGALIRGNWIQGNEMETGTGAGIDVRGAARIIGNRICNNEILDGGAGGGGITVQGLSGRRVTIQGNEIFNNKVFDLTFPFTSEGGGIWAGGLVDASENIIACNWAYKGVGWSGAGTAGDTASTIERNTIVFNLVIDQDPDAVAGARFWFNAGFPLEFFANSVFGNFGVGFRCFGEGPFDFACNNVFGNLPNFLNGDPCEQLIGVDGNISSDPMFGGDLDCTCTGEPDPSDYCLQPGSPQLPENSPPECDLIGARGACTPIGVRDVDSSSPARLRALPAFPNPFSQRTTIAVQIARDADVEIAIFDVVGRRVRTLREGWMLAGHHVFEWDGRDDAGMRAASGGYIARIQVGGQELTRTLLLIR